MINRDKDLLKRLIQGDAQAAPLTSKFFMEIFAKDRSITLSERFCALTYSEAGEPPRIIRGEENGFVEENSAFIKALQEGGPMPINHYDGMMATLMIVQAVKSLKSNKVESIVAPIAGS